MKSTRRFPPLLWLNVLSLDAPLVAIVWQIFLALLNDRPIEWNHPILLGFATWLAYSADRLLDGFRARGEEVLAPRHQFAIQHRQGLLIVWGVVFVMTLLIAWFGLERPLLLRGVLLAAGVAVYFLLVFTFPRVLRGRFSRESTVSLLFVTGTAFFVLQPSDLRSPEVGVSLAWFAALCFLNCLLISFWEQETDLLTQQVSAATTLPKLRNSANRILILAMIAAFASWVFAPWDAVRLTLVAVIVSIGFLFAINRVPISHEIKPVWADLALLSPLLLYWFA